MSVTFYMSLRTSGLKLKASALVHYAGLVLFFFKGSRYFCQDLEVLQDLQDLF